MLWLKWMEFLSHAHSPAQGWSPVLRGDRDTGLCVTLSWSSDTHVVSHSPRPVLVTNIQRCVENNPDQCEAKYLMIAWSILSLCLIISWIRGFLCLWLIKFSLDIPAIIERHKRCISMHCQWWANHRPVLWSRDLPEPIRDRETDTPPAKAVTKQKPSFITSLSPGPGPAWKEERERRGGIPLVSLLSDTESHNNTEMMKLSLPALSNSNSKYNNTVFMILCLVIRKNWADNNS